MLAHIKSGAVVCNIGHFDNEIDTKFLREKYEWQEVKPQVHRIFRDGKNEENFIILLSEGRLVNLGNATGHPSRIMDGSFANQVLAQMHLYSKKWADKKSEPVFVKVLPKKLDEEVARNMVEGFGGVITQLTPDQAKYINVKVEGPYKLDEYKY
jgi:adenosylhomocysteinase